MAKQERGLSSLKGRKGQQREQISTTKEQSEVKLAKTKAGEEAVRLIAKQYDEGWARVREGRPVAWVMYGPPREIMRCFDVLDLYPEHYASICAIKKQTSPYIEYSEEEGFSSFICGYLRHALGYALALARGESTETALYGGIARPSMLISCSRICDPRFKIFEVMRRYLDVPAFIYDHQVPPTEDPRCTDKETAERIIQHNAEGLKALVSFLEEETGKRMDWDMLAELVRNSIEMWHIFYHCCEMRKNIPCPLPSEDYITVWRPFRDLAGEPEGLQFYRDLQQELQERIRNKVSVVPEEKYRLLWVGLPTWFDTDIYNYLESRGAVSVADSMFRPTRPHEIDTSDPLRALAEKEYWSWDFYGGSDGSQPRCGLISGSYILELAGNYNVDGVITHTVISCRSVSIGTRHMAKLLREQMGLPGLSIESHMTDPCSYSHAEVREKIDAFIQILEGRK